MASRTTRAVTDLASLRAVVGPDAPDAVLSALLEEHGKPFTIREYLVDMPSFDELSDLRKALKLEPIEWARTMDAAWCEHFDNVTIFDDILPEEDDIFRAMAKLPIMIERPILWRGERAVIGRPPERILELLDDE